MSFKVTRIPLTPDSVLESACEINAFVEGATNIKFFSLVKTGTVSILSHFEVTRNFTQISQYFPTFIPGEEVAVHNSDCLFYLTLKSPLPRIVLCSNINTLEIDSNTVLDENKLLGLYEPSKPLAVEKIGIGKHMDLKTIHTKITNGSIYATCYAVIVDCSGSYIPKSGENQDFIVTFKITDPSIFPNHACVNIFHKNPKDIPKIMNFGDIIKLVDIQFKEYSGLLQGVIGSNSKSMGYFLIPYSGSTIVPYATYKSVFHNSNDHSLYVEKLSLWILRTFADEFPLFMNNTKRLTNIFPNEEVDLVTRVIKIYSMGVQKSDPFVFICGDNSEICQLIIPEERKKMLKYIEEGDLIRIRSVNYEEKILYLNLYSEILKIPAEFSSIKVSINPNSEELKKYIQIYEPIPNCKIVSKIAENYKFYPLITYDKILNFPIESIIKVEGFVVKIKSFKELEIVMWDGESDNNLIVVYVQDQNLAEFAQGKSLETIRKDIIRYDCKLQAVVQLMKKGLYLVGTSLII